MEKPIFNRSLFWDVDFDNFDYDKYPEWVIERIFERGDVEDIRQCRRYYGNEKVCKALKQAKWLSLQTVYLACAVCDNELNDYRCYNIAQSNPGHFGY